MGFLKLYQAWLEAFACVANFVHLMRQPLGGTYNGRNEPCSCFDELIRQGN